MNLFNRSARKRQAVIAAAVALAESKVTLSDIQLKLAWSKLQLRINETPKLSKRKDHLRKELPEALALVREAGRRAVGLEAYPVQLEGALVLMDGQLAEMRTGEGKTLVAAMGGALASLIYDHVHLVTVNEYLAQRDCASMTGLLEALGLTCRVVLSTQTADEKRDAYAAHVTYGINSEFGFDFLRNHMTSAEAEKTQPMLATTLAIVDEADAILIDDARTPLIITQPAPVPVEHLPRVAAFVRTLVSGTDYDVDEKAQRVSLTEQGYARVEEWLHAQGWLQSHAHLYDEQGAELLYRMEAAFRAEFLFKRDVQYLVSSQGEVAIIDESTGRIMVGRRWSEGLHQAIEAKEGVAIQPESEVYATITYQHFFRMYGGLAGLTGTVATEKTEMEEMYGLLVAVVPTHRPVIRKDWADRVYRSAKDKFEAMVLDIKERHAKGQPVLVGTPSVVVSEHLATLLTRAGLTFALLNARQNGQEADIVAQAGLPGAITVATNMAGRGTDIILGGNFEKQIKALRAEGRAAEAEALHATWQANREQVCAAGGLCVLSAERHESRRIDNQLRGRAGRQGDPGESRFYLSLEDDLLRVFGQGMGRFAIAQLQEGESLEAPILSRAIARAQQARENFAFEQRRQLARYDGVLADQRQAVYGLRNQILEGGATDLLQAWANDQLGRALAVALPDDLPLEMVTPAAMVASLTAELTWSPSEEVLAELLKAHDEAEPVIEAVSALWAAHYAEVVAEAEVATEGRLELVALGALDRLWRTQLTHLESLREGIHLRAYAQKDPQREYYEEAGRLFESMAAALRREAMSLLLSIATHATAVATREPNTAPAAAGHYPAPFLLATGRNRTCACGSGLRFKHCCGQLRVGPAAGPLPLPTVPLQLASTLA